MKVPYLKEKRRSEMTELATEFSLVISNNLEIGELSSRLHAGWLNNLHSLFALLQILLNSAHTLNPSREYALEGAKRTEDSELFLEAMKSFQASPEVLEKMRAAYSATIFSGFIAELRSDVLMVFVHGLMYSYRNAAISLRCALEDFYRHMYYMDHVQEYRALQEGRETEHGMHLSPLRFREYIRRTSYLQCFFEVTTDFALKTAGSDAEMDLFGLNEELYASLSAAVHGASSEWFAAIQNAKSLQHNLEKENKLQALCSKFSKMCIAFLIAAHRDVFSSVGDYDKSIILDIFSLEERKNFRHLLNL